MAQCSAGEYYLGREVDADGAPTEAPLCFDGRDLTTHGVVVGMTGSGKTGLGVIALEEALLSGTPTLVLDPKGDMTNLRLRFPALRGADFEPWIDPDEARRTARSPAEHASATAERWREGLAGSGIGPERLARLAETTEVTIYTPGSTAGVPLNLLGSLRAPTEGFEANAEALRDEIEGFVSGLLGLIGIEADPIASREHILLANLIEHAWSAGRDLDLGTLVALVQRPPLRKLGVFELDAFFPADERTALAMRLNGLMAAPSFAPWLAGPPLDIAALLGPRDGRVPAAVIYLAHLSEAERQLVVTLVLSRLITWMRAQPGSSELRTLVYMDEVFGFVPPTASPPSKRPLLTLLKQARAYGVGLLLATQNPVDLDYKAMSNAGTWLVGRLQTERDKARVLEGLEGVRGWDDIKALDRRISGLGKRQFVLHSVHLDGPRVFGTRWAMSYLRGPLTRAEIERLTADVALPSAEPAGAEAVAEPALADDESEVMPAVAAGVSVYHLDPAAPWADAVGADPRGRRLEAALAARVQLKYDDRAAKVDHREEWEAVYHPVGAGFDPGAALTVDHDPRDFESEAPDGAVYVLPAAPLDDEGFFRDAERALRDALYHDRTVEVFRNEPLELYSRVGETREAFAARCAEAAARAADREMAELRDTFAKRMDRVQAAMRAAGRRAAELEADVSARQQEELLGTAGSLLGALLGGRGASRKVARVARTLSTASSRRSRRVRTEERLESALDKVEGKAEDLDALEAELAAEIEAIDEAWTARAEEIERLTVGLEKSDIRVDELAVVWIPTTSEG